MAILLALLLAAPAVGGSAEDGSWAVVGCRVFDGERLVGDGVVVFDEEGIRAVGRRGEVDVPEGARRIEGVGRTLLPGLADLHVHVFGHRGGPGGALGAAAAAGVTTLLDLNAPEPRVFEWIEARAGDGGPARLLAAGAAITARGGHGAEGGFPACEVEPGGLGDLLARLEIDLDGRAVLKAVLDPGFGTARRPTLAPSDLRRLSEAAHEHGLPLVVHVTDTASALVAIEAGADALAHLPLLGGDLDRVAAVCAERGVAVMPTLAAWRQAARGTADRLGRRIGSALASAGPALRRLDEASLLLCGSDAGVPGVPIGEGTVRELFEWRALGVPPGRCLEAATARAGRFLGEEGVGRVVPGARADLLLVEGDPLHDLGALRRVVAVWRAGRLVAPERPPTRRSDPVPFSTPLDERLAAASVRSLGGRGSGGEASPPADGGRGWSIRIVTGPRTSPDRPAGVRFVFDPPIRLAGARGLLVALSADRRAAVRIRWLGDHEAGVDPFGWDLGIDERTRRFRLDLLAVRRRGFAFGAPRAKGDVLAALDLVVEDDGPPLRVRLESVAAYGASDQPGAGASPRSGRAEEEGSR